MQPSGLEMVSGQALPAFLLCSTLLVIKMYAVAVITGQVRLRKKAFANPEDAMRHGGLKYCRSDPDVERCLRKVRDLRDWKTGVNLVLGFSSPFFPVVGILGSGHSLSFFAHRNDMETIYPFLFLGLVYSFLGPDPFIAQMHFLVVFVGRMLHTVAYLGKLRAPTRSLAYTLAQLPCASMALQILWETVRHL